MAIVRSIEIAERRKQWSSTDLSKRTDAEKKIAGP